MVRGEEEIIDLIDSGDEVEVIDVEAVSDTCAKRARIDVKEEEDDDVILVSGPPQRPIPPEVVEVRREELSDDAKEKLVKQLLAEKEKLLAQVDSLSSQVAVRQRPSRHEPPGYWRRDGRGQRLDEDPTDASYTLINLDLACPEGESIARRFVAKGMADATVVSISRCHNLRLWEDYAAQRAKLAAKLGGPASSYHDALPGVEAESSTYASNKTCERYLFHGASPKTVDSILEGGIDFRLSQPTGAMGACAYFADQSIYSHNYCCMAEHSVEHHGGYVSPQPVNATLKMLLCRVLLGECAHGCSGLRRPPPKRPSSSDLYDSVSNDPSQATNFNSTGFMFGVFDNAQVYPEYVIMYQKAAPQPPTFAFQVPLPNIVAAAAALARGQPLPRGANPPPSGGHRKRTSRRRSRR